MKDKVCPSCKQRKPSELFALDRTKTTGRSSWCIECRRVANLDAYVRNREVVLKARAEYREGNRERLAIARRALRALPESKAKRNAEKRRRQADIAARTKPHDAHVRAWAVHARKPTPKPRDLQDAHVLTLKADSARWFRVRYQHNAEFNLNQRIRAQLRKAGKADRHVADMLRHALKNRGRSPTAERFLGCSLAQFRTHIERQFTRGMSWERFAAGEIHLDHIVPRSSFHLSDPAEVAACWNIGNLRPLWAADNLEKSARRVSLL